MKFFAVILMLSACSAPVPAQPINRLAEEEAVLSGALAIRARAIETKTGIKFGGGWKAKARLENLSFGRGQSAAGQYEVATGDILLSTSIWSGLNVRLKKPLRLATAQEVAADEYFQEIADHELGHALADMVSRRHGLGPWFTEEFKQSLKNPESLGLNVVSEGVGRWIEYTIHPARDNFSEFAFPGTYEEQRFYDYEMVVYSGGYWIVKDVLNRYGERGLVWLIKHPLSLGDGTMRADAAAYREKALRELAGPAN